jgi:acetyl esterase/lipase
MPTPARPLRPVRSRRRITLAVAAAVVLSLTLGACRVNSVNIAPADKLAAGSPEKMVPSRADVAYGPDAMHKLDIYRPTNGENVGTVVYFHAGGWVSGTRKDTSAIILAQRARGWSVVSVEYRLSPAVRAPQLLADADRSMRWVRANGSSYGLNVGTIVAAGASAGGHIAAMMGAASGVFVDPALPSKLASTSPRPDGIINMVGPADLSTFAQAGGWAPGLIDSFLGCTMGGSDTTLARCDPQYAKYHSPLWWAQLAAWFKAPLPPAYLAYGPFDALVRLDTQGDPLYGPWNMAAGDAATWYETPQWGGHNLDFEINKTMFDTWLTKVKDRSF